MSSRRLLTSLLVLACAAPATASAQDAPIVLPGEEIPAVTTPTVTTPAPTVTTPAPEVEDPSWPQTDPTDDWPQTPAVELKPGLRLRSDGTVGVDSRVPKTVRAVIRAANRIAHTPYKWGGGHATLTDSGYDCSGSVSYALRGGGLIGWTKVSGQFKSWGRSGRGRWITVFANNGHVYMDVGGLRYDTSGRSGRQTRWQLGSRPSTRFTIRHPPGL